MKFGMKRYIVALSLVAGFVLLASGCSQAENKGGRAKDKGVGDQEKPVQVADNKHGDHSGWWCDEHGVPEDVCGQCNAKLAGEFKKKGDWCKEHDRPESQCFICNPKSKDKFAAQYRAKYGKEPPPTEDDASKDTKKEDKKG